MGGIAHAVLVLIHELVGLAVVISELVTIVHVHVVPLLVLY